MWEPVRARHHIFHAPVFRASISTIARNLIRKDVFNSLREGRRNIFIDNTVVIVPKMIIIGANISHMS